MLFLSCFVLFSMLKKIVWMHINIECESKIAKSRCFFIVCLFLCCVLSMNRTYSKFCVCKEREPDTCVPIELNKSTVFWLKTKQKKKKQCNGALMYIGQLTIIQLTIRDCWPFVLVRCFSSHFFVLHFAVARCYLFGIH